MQEQAKDILITGARGGMGRAVTRALTDAGYRVFALDLSPDPEPVQPGVIPIIADLTDGEQVGRALAQVRAHTDRLQAIVHFAGIYRMDSLVEMTEADFSQIFAVNLKGAFLINRTFLPLLGKGSRILITTSELAPLSPLPFTGIYALTKGALDKYAFSLAMELQLLGISVSVLRAGAVDTGMLGASTASMERFCQTTRLYTLHADRFRSIVNAVEARHIPASRLAKRVLRILESRRPAFAYSINRNPLLLGLDLLPLRWQLAAIRWVLR